MLPPPSLPPSPPSLPPSLLSALPIQVSFKFGPQKSCRQFFYKLRVPAGDSPDMKTNNSDSMAFRRRRMMPRYAPIRIATNDAPLKAHRPDNIAEGAPNTARPHPAPCANTCANFLNLGAPKKLARLHKNWRHVFDECHTDSHQTKIGVKLAQKSAHKLAHHFAKIGAKIGAAIGSTIRTFLAAWLAPLFTRALNARASSASSVFPLHT